MSEEDWTRLTEAWKKVRDNHWDPKLVLFVDIRDLRRADNKGIDFVIRRLMASEKYRYRIRLHGGPPSTYPRYPLRVYDPFMGKERHYFLVEIPELRLPRWSS